MYVSGESRKALEELLRRLPAARARSASAAIFEAISGFLHDWDLEEAGYHPHNVHIPMEELLTRIRRALLAPDVDDDSVEANAHNYSTEELAELLKPVLLTQALQGLRDSAQLYKLTGGKRSHFPYPAIRQAVEEMVQAAEDGNLMAGSYSFESLARKYVLGEWKQHLRAVAKSPDLIKDPQAMIADMRETIGKLEAVLTCESTEGKD